MQVAVQQASQKVTHAESSTKPIISGVITGQFAGLIMAVVVMAVFALFLGKSPLFPVQVIGSTVFGQEALQGTHIGAVLAGLVLHQLGPALLWGVIYGLLARSLVIDKVSSALALGISLGFISMVGPYFLIPAVMKMLHGVDFWNQEVPILWDWAAHIVFGASFALYPKVLERVK